MWGSLVLDMALGLALLYLLLALACSAANELLAGLIDRRAAYLARGLRTLLEDDSFQLSNPQTGNQETLLSLFSSHPLICSLREDGTKPSYLPPAKFAMVLVDLLSTGSPGEIAAIRATLAKMPAQSTLRRSLLTLLDASEGKLETFRTHLAGWFDDGMARVSAWYKRNTQLTVLLFAGLLSVATNADTFAVARHLALDPATRQLVAERAREVLARDAAVEPSEASTKSDSAATVRALHESVAQLSSLGLPLGWSGQLPSDPLAWLSRALGLLVTCLATSLGAPFWFDILNRVANVRAVGRRPGERDTAAPKPVASVVAIEALPPAAAEAQRG